LQLNTNLDFSLLGIGGLVHFPTQLLRLQPRFTDIIQTPVNIVRNVMQSVYVA